MPIVYARLRGAMAAAHSETRVLVSVTDHLRRPADATVEVRRRGAKAWTKAVRDGDVHAARFDAPVTVELRVRGPARWRPHHLTAVLRPGVNRVRAMVAPRDVRFLPAAHGARAFYQPPPRDRIWLQAEGARVRPWLYWVLGARKLPFRDVSGDSPAIVHRARLEIAVPSSAAARRRVGQQLAHLVDVECAEQDVIAQVTAPLPGAGGGHRGLTDRLIVRFARAITPRRRADFEERHAVTFVHPLAGDDGAYLVRTGALPGPEVLARAERMRADPGVVRVEPDLVWFDAHAHAPDLLWSQQPAMHRIGAEPAWAAAGHAGVPNIVVAVVDLQGVDGAHPAYAGRVIQNWDFVRNRATQPIDLFGDHGTQCAAAAVGATDAHGTAGVAPGCRLIGVYLSENPSTANIHDAWLWSAGATVHRGAGSPPTLAIADRARVISNSWGTPWTESSPELAAALALVSTPTAAQPGCVVCFSTGNDGYVPFASWYPIAADPNAVAVGASVDGAAGEQRAPYSPYGALDLVAPSCAAFAAGTIVGPVVSATRTGRGNWLGAITRTTQVTGAPVRTAAGSPRWVVPVKDATGFAVRGVALFGRPGGPQGFRFLSISAVSIKGNRHAITVGPIDPWPAAWQLAWPDVSTGPADYGDTFGGTSHAAALVAGAAALVLSVQPGLTPPQVRSILRASAKPIDLGQTHPDGVWTPSAAPRFSQWYGYGRLDVAGAVALARQAAADPTVLDELAGLLDGTPEVSETPG